jgi:hypothetical protein
MWIVLAGVACAGLAPPSGAQSMPFKGPPQPPMPRVLDLKDFPLLEDLQYPAAKEKAKRTSRIVLIFWCGDPPTNPRWTFLACQNSITLRAYIKWHAVAIWLRMLPPELMDEACRFMKQQNSDSPAVLVVRDGHVEAFVGSERPGGIGIGVQIRGNPCLPLGKTLDPDDRLYVPHPIRVLYQTDFAMERIAARDPVWMEIHKRDNPEPKAPPEPEPANMVRDELAPVVYDPRPEEHIGALDRLDEARRLVREGDLYRATGVYTWLWERGAAMDPAFRPARLSALAQDLDALTSRHKEALEKFSNIREERNLRLPWAEYGQMHEWFVLNGVTHNAEDTLSYFDYFTNDPDEGGMIPPEDAKAYSLLTLRENFVRAWEMPGEPVARVRRIADRIDPKFPATVKEKERTEYRAFARQYLLDEGCRIYTACLVKGDETSAQRVAEIVLGARNDDAARLSLIETALAADPPQARPIHEQWLVEAETASGTPRPDLHNRLTLGIREPAGK